MNVLAFDTCFGALSVAAWSPTADGEGRLREAFELRAAGHAERLFPMMAGVMGAADLAFADIDRIAVTLGPGTFTGVRVGISAARALALATGKPVVGITSLAAMAHRAEDLLEGGLTGRPLIVAVDARRGMFYVQTFAAGGAQASEALLLAPEEAALRIGPERVVVVGSGASAVAAAVCNRGGEAQACLPDLQPHAGALARIAEGLAPIASVRPLYLRLPDAKPQGEAPVGASQA